MSACVRAQSPAGPAAVSVLSVEGPGAAPALSRVFARRGGRRALPGPGRAALGVIEAADGSPADEVLLVRTGEERFEVDGHGGRGARERILEALRADGLARAEAPLPSPVARARTWLGVRVASWVEAGLVPEGHPVARRLLGAPARVVLSGLPNAGKSALLNALLERERALVSPEAGTTRDVLEEETALLGVPIFLCDAAGVEDPAAGEAPDPAPSRAREEPATAPEVAREAEARARAAAATADLVLRCIDGAAPPAPATVARIAASALDPRVILVVTKADLPRAWDAPAAALRVSSATGVGLDALGRAIAARLLGKDPGAITGPGALGAPSSGGHP